MKSEQWWMLGVRNSIGEVIVIRPTRSGLARFRWTRRMRDDDNVNVAREVWTVDGRFDGECYASTDWSRE